MARLPIIGGDRDVWGTQLNDFLEIEHGAGGFHNITYGDIASRPGAPEVGQIYINTENETLEQYTTSWIERATKFPSGTKMIFYQASAPTGWTKDTADNDKALRVVSGSGGVTAGTNSFSTILTSQITSDTEATHTHSTPNHTHPFATSGTTSDANTWHDVFVLSGTLRGKVTGGGAGDYPIIQDDTTSSGSSTSGTGTAHSHTDTFDIDYMDVIICSKD